jgi:hypothetical protein
MKLSELEELYFQLMSMPLSQLSQYIDDERVGILYEGKSIRIFLIRSPTHKNYIRIEIEFQTCPNLERLPEKDEIRILDTMIWDIQYLRELIHHGFQLDIIEDSCIWSLRKEFNEGIDQSNLSLLLPPR